MPPNIAISDQINASRPAEAGHWREKKTMERRIFLMGMAGAAALAGAVERVNLAVIGLGGRGQRHIKDYATLSGCRIAAVCDIDADRLAHGQAAVLEATGSKPQAFTDLRRLYEDKSI